MAGSNGVIARLVAEVGYDVDKRSQAQAEKGLKSLKDFAQKAAVAVASIFVTKKIFDFVNATATAADQVAKLSRVFGLTGEEFQKISFAAERTGVEVSKIGPALRAITRRAAEAANGNKLYAETFTKLGVDVEDGNKKLKPTAQLFREVADGIKNTQSQGERLRLLQNVADEMGPSLVNLLSGGSEALDAFGTELEEIGLIPDEHLKLFEEYTDTLANFSRAWEALKARIVVSVLPAFQKIVDFFIEVKKNTPQGVLEALGRVMLFAAGAAAALATVLLTKLLIAFAPILVPLGLLAFAIDELYTLFTGGDSVIGRFIDKLFGPGSAAEAVEFLKEKFEVLVPFLKGAVIGTFKTLGKVISIVFDSFIASLQVAVSLVRFLGKAIGALFSEDTSFFDFLKGFKFKGSGFDLALDTVKEIKKTASSIDFSGDVGEATDEAIGTQRLEQAFATGDMPELISLTPNISSAGASSSMSQSAEVTINVETKSNASASDIGRAVSQGSEQGVKKSFRALRDSRLPRTPP